jgi:hypothetical protein
MAVRRNKGALLTCYTSFVLEPGDKARKQFGWLRSSLQCSCDLFRDGANSWLPLRPGLSFPDKRLRWPVLGFISGGSLKRLASLSNPARCLRAPPHFHPTKNGAAPDVAVPPLGNPPPSQPPIA